MTRKEIFTAAHSIAREIQADENIKRYSKALSRGLKIVWATAKQIEAAKVADIEIKTIITNSIDKNLALFVDYSNGYKINESKKALAKELESYSYKSWYVNGGLQMFFSPQVINALTIN